ncbi:H-NS histone family protein [Ralstonia pickettii]|uniref:H-NS histone family protein n=1 Tax=Ralstonia pickettii TaxID=329 RepID=UPI002041CEA6|nr:H-NS histone family protein [Ralstonia pickettii]MCM3583717.1 H-NS histone family protein [Ralstonia pickettii]
MATYKELVAQRETLDAQIAEAQAKERDSALAQIRRIMDDAGLTVEDIVGRRRGGKSTKGNVVPPKYRDPKTGTTWSGRGRMPAWLVGKQLNRFLIDKE